MSTFKTKMALTQVWQLKSRTLIPTHKNYSLYYTHSHLVQNYSTTKIFSLRHFIKHLMCKLPKCEQSIQLGNSLHTHKHASISHSLTTQNSHKFNQQDARNSEIFELERKGESGGNLRLGSE